MPDYGISEKSPERMQEEQFNNEIRETFRDWDEAERKENQRKTDAEISQIEVARMLRELDEKLDRDRAERLASEARAEKIQRAHLLENRVWQAILVTIGLLSLLAPVLFRS